MDISLTAKVRFLSEKESYPDTTTTVERRETHMSWVFLTDRYAYKMKKPVRHPFLDYTSLEKREHMCREELRLNRRLASWVYLDVLPLTRAPAGRLELDGKGEPVEWLVKMNRLPAERMLDEAIRSGSVEREGVERAAQHLADFYARAVCVELPGAEYLQRFIASIAENEREFEAMGLNESGYRDAIAALRVFTESHGATLSERAEQGHIVEGHGDLRPDHVFLGEPAAVIDCLEFSRAWRVIDPVEELAFLTMESTRLGGERWAEIFFDAYFERTLDQVPKAIVRFYMCSRACLRAKLSLWHLKDGAVSDPDKWRTRAADYLGLANRYAAQF